MTMIIEYRLAIMIGALLLLILLSSRKSGKNRILHTLIVTLAMSITYEFVMHEPVSRIPDRISQALNQPSSSNKSSVPNYYAPIDKKYNLPTEE